MRSCPQCGVETPDQAKFCGNCGYILSLPSPTQPGSPVSLSPSNPPRFIPPPGITPGSVSSPSPHYVQRPPVQSYTPSYHAEPAALIPPRKNNRLIFAWIGIVAVIILAVSGLLLFLSSNNQPDLSILQGQPVSGQPITLRGEHFPSGSSVSLVVDTQPLLLSLSSINLQAGLFPSTFTARQGIIYRAVVGSDGTFTVTIRVPGLWKAGSKFIVIAQVTSVNPQQVKPVKYQITVLR